MKTRRRIAVPVWKITLFGIQLSIIKTENASGETGLNVTSVHGRNPEQRMSQTRTSAHVCDTTASPPEADMTGSPRDVAEVPFPDMEPLPHQVGSEVTC